jgi:hypothetical protein
MLLRMALHRKLKLNGNSLRAVIASQRLLFKVPSNTVSASERFLAISPTQAPEMHCESRTTTSWITCLPSRPQELPLARLNGSKAMQEMPKMKLLTVLLMQCVQRMTTIPSSLLTRGNLLERGWSNLGTTGPLPSPINPSI